MYRETKPGSHIWEITEETEYAAGWYYADETDSFGGGPYKTEDAAKAALKEYCEWLEKPCVPPVKV